MTPGAPGMRAGVDSLLERLKTAVPSATAGPWAAPPGPYMALPGAILSQYRGLGLNAVVAVASAPADARSIAQWRRFAPAFGATVHALVRRAREAGDHGIDRDQVLDLCAGGWGDGGTRWNWDGWDPATQRGVEPPAESSLRKDWGLKLTAGGARTSRTSSVPRGTLATSTPSEWSVADDGNNRGSLRRVVDGDGTVVAEFHRASDAAFTVVARPAVAVLGAIVEHVELAVGSEPHAAVTGRELFAMMARAEPWPLDGTTPTPGTAGGRAR